jgi:hypothetical protein
LATLIDVVDGARASSILMKRKYLVIVSAEIVENST